MYWHPWRKLVAASGAIAAGGLLACAAALLNLLAPTASTMAFLGVMTLLGLAVAGVVAAFTWLCGCWDDSLPDEVDRAAGGGPRGLGGPANNTELQTALDRERRAASCASRRRRAIGATSTGRRFAESSRSSPARRCRTPRPSHRRVAGGMDSSKHSFGAAVMDLHVWLPAMFFLGLAVFGLMFACIPACDKV